MGKAKAACYNVKQMAGKSNVSLSRPVGKHQVNLNADNNVNLRLNKYKVRNNGHFLV